MSIFLSGLASGLDTESVISQLMAIEQNKVTAVQWRQTSLTQHKTDLGTVKSKLDALKSAATDLASATTWKATQTTTSSDPAKLDVALLGGAGIGGQSVRIDRLASSAQRGFSFTPSAAAGSLTFYYGTDPNAPDNGKLTIDVPENATAAQIAAAINGKENAPVYAAVVKDGADERLVFSARKTGDSSNFTVDTSGMDASHGMGLLSQYTRDTDLNAVYRLNNEPTTRESESNVVENAIPGVRLTLKGVSADALSVNTTQAAIDTDAIVKKITAFVDAYNAVVTATRAELTEKRVPGASTTSDLQKGQLFGDYQLSSMLGTLKQKITQPFDDLGLRLSDFGIGVPKAGASSQDAKDGKLTIDADKLKEALTADASQVRKLFAGEGAIKGLSGELSDYINGQTGRDGTLTNRIAGDDKRMQDFNDQIAKLNQRMEAQQERLKAQFAAMETALSTSQSQSQWLAGQIASLPTYG